VQKLHYHSLRITHFQKFSKLRKKFQSAISGLGARKKFIYLVGYRYVLHVDKSLWMMGCTCHITSPLY